MSRATSKPHTLVYSCSGCSDVAQLANDVALRLDHSGAAEMSCIAGVTPTEHVKLYERGLRKRRGRFYDEATVAEVATEVGELIACLPMDAEAGVAPARVRT